ncbi:TPA: hypothetical protein HA242_02470 [Candidatus Woesearchaeota archaeon]|nr:hypothetical protein [Candidatus Woesearchaeota archaeon]HIG92880.1 hypothetical protein [Candidatus Woesearchaeota archaeon]HIH12564.1 hypothetical protein [Candidatus Woesearchaeota archaeon]
MALSMRLQQMVPHSPLSTPYLTELVEFWPRVFQENKIVTGLDYNHFQQFVKEWLR